MLHFLAVLWDVLRLRAPGVSCVHGEAVSSGTSTGEFGRKTLSSGWYIHISFHSMGPDRGSLCLLQTSGLERACKHGGNKQGWCELSSLKEMLSNSHHLHPEPSASSVSQHQSQACCQGGYTYLHWDPSCLQECGSCQCFSCRPGCRCTFCGS